MNDKISACSGISAVDYTFMIATTPMKWTLILNSFSWIRQTVYNVISEVYIRALRLFHTETGNYNSLVWIRRITYNVIRETSRMQSRQMLLSKPQVALITTPDNLVSEFNEFRDNLQALWRQFSREKQKLLPTGGNSKLNLRGKGWSKTNRSISAQPWPIL